MNNRFIDEDLDWLVEDEPTKQRFNPYHEPGGSSEGGQFASAPGGGEGGGGEGGGGGKETVGPSGGKAKTDTKVSDFTKDKVALDHYTQTDPDDFLKLWNEKFQQAPGDFQKEFLAGVNATMGISYSHYGNQVGVSGTFLDPRGRETTGTYDEHLNFDKRDAYIDYMVLPKGEGGKGTVKKLFGAQIEQWKKFGFTQVRLFADIPAPRGTGGYSWAKYGFVPERNDWQQLQNVLHGRADRIFGTSGGRGGSREPTVRGDIADDWDMLSSDQQENIEQTFYEQTRMEFLDSEIESWREGGEPLEIAKQDLTSGFNTSAGPEWAKHAIDSFRDSFKGTIPFTNEQLLASMSLHYNSKYGDGRGDVEVTFNDEKLSAPQGFDPSQLILPGVAKIEPHEHLTEEMRDGIEKSIQSAFETQAEHDAADVEPPNYLSDSASESQHDFWSQFSDAERLNWGIHHASDINVRVEIPPEEEEQPELPKTPSATDDQESGIRKLINSNDPKAIWAISDSPFGKALLIGTNWHGALKFNDKQSMDRFNSYVGKKRAA